jgi:cytochrome c5
VKALRFFAPLLACLAACGSAAVPEPTAADASRGSAHFPDLTLGELHQGRTLYLNRCGSCHVLKRPVELAPEQWQVEVDEMRGKNGVKLSDDEARAIVRYLAVAASAG